MNLTDDRLKGLDDPLSTPTDRASLRCQVAADLILAGQYEAAREALGELWRGIGERPDTEGLNERTAAEVLLQAGALSGWLGTTRQVAGAQDKAKDLINESAALFERIGETGRAAFARSDLGLCYWHEGAYDEARVFISKAFEQIIEKVDRAKVLLRLINVEFLACRYHDAFTFLEDYAHLFDEQVPPALRGSFHGTLALVLNQLGTAEGRPDYLDRAIIEYTEAIYHFEQAGNERYCATNLNNLAFLLYKLGRYGEAHARLDKALRILTRLKDAGTAAQFNETRARVFLAENKNREANRVIAGAIQTLEKGGPSAILADALTAQGVIWARLGVHESSLLILRRAADMAEDVGASSHAGHTILALIEEHGAKRLTQAEAYGAYVRADRLLRDTQNAEDVARLRSCARIVMRRLYGTWLHENFTLTGAVHELEGRLIEQALEDSDGSVTRAARLLGLKHQTLIAMMKRKHQRLLKKRRQEASIMPLVARSVRRTTGHIRRKERAVLRGRVSWRRFLICFIQ